MCTRITQTTHNCCEETSSYADIHSDTQRCLIDAPWMPNRCPIDGHQRLGSMVYIRAIDAADRKTSLWCPTKYHFDSQQKALVEYVLRMWRKGYSLPTKLLRSLAHVIRRQRTPN